MTAPTAASAAPDPTTFYHQHPGARQVVLLIVCIGSLFNPLMLSGVNVAVPTIAAELNAGAIAVSWLPTSFVLAAAALSLPIGKLADIYGRKRLYLLGILVSMLGGLMAGLADSMEMLLGARAVQGISGAMIFAPGAAIITSVFPAERLGSALGFQAAAVYVGLTLGPWVGGVVTEAFGWRWIFLSQVGLSLLILGGTVLFLKGEWKVEQRPRFDLPGSFIFAIAIGAFVLGLSRITTPAGLGFAGVGVIGGMAFVAHQLRVEHPLVRIRILRRNRSFSLALAASTLMYGASFPVVFLLSLYLQYIGGLSPAETGRILVVQALVMAIGAPLAGRLSDRILPRKLATGGCLVVAIGFLWLLLLDQRSPVWIVIVGQLVVGAGFACFSTPNNSSAMRALTTGNIGVAAALLSLSRTLGNLVCMGIVVLIMSLKLGDIPIESAPTDRFLASIHLALALAAGYALVAAYVSWMRVRRLQP